MASFSSSSSSSSCSKSKHLNIVSLLFTLLLLVTSATATRPGVSLMAEGRALQEAENMKAERRLYETGFVYRSQLFNFFPKGSPIPPSGPSKQHNSIEN